MSDTNEEREQQLFDSWFSKRYGRKPDMHGNDGDCGRWSAWLGRAHLKQEPALLLQDENSGREGRRYNEWHASRPDARMNAREAAAALTPHPETPAPLRPCSYMSMSDKPTMCVKCGQVHKDPIYAAPMPQSAGVTDEQLHILDRLYCAGWNREGNHKEEALRAVLALAPGLAPYQPQPEPTSKGEPVSEEIAAMLGERVAFLRDPAVYRGKYWDSMTNEQRKQAFTKLDCGAAGYAKKFWTWRHFDMAAEDIGMASQQRETQEAAGYLDGVNVDRLRKALTKMGCSSGAGEEDAASRLAELVNRLTLSVERFALSAPQEAGKVEIASGVTVDYKPSVQCTCGAEWECGQFGWEMVAAPHSKEASKVEAVADERQPSDGDYLRWAEQAGAKVNWDFESASSARVVFLTASQWGRFCDKVRTLYLRPSQQALSEEAIRAWWASENGMEDFELCKLADFSRMVRLVEHKLGIKPTSVLASSGSKGGGE